MITLLKTENRPLTPEEQNTVIGCVINETEIKYYQQEDIEEYKEYLKTIEPPAEEAIE
jgi:hypothetical protein